MSTFNPAASLPDFDQPVVVVLDDEELVRESLQARLERSGYRVITAGDYKEFTHLMADYDAVLCDIILPGNNGLQALKWASQYYPHTPVIMMTGEPTFQTAAEAIRLGAYDYLAKPIDKEELLTTLARAIEHRRLALTKEQLERENETYRLELEQRVIERTGALRESQEFLTNLTNTMADPVLSLKLPDYQIEYVNQAVSHVFGYQSEELQGQSFRLFFPDQASFDIFVKKQQATFKAGQTQMHLEQLLNDKTDKLIWTEIAASFLGTDEPLTRIICVIRDISQRTLLLGVVAHELRGPLALLKGFSEVILEDLQNLDQKEVAKYLKSVNSTAVRLFTLLNELLDVTSIELGQISLVLEPTDLRELIDTQLTSYAYLANKKNITLNKQFPAEALVCYCDALRVVQVISNFIDNAIKYSEPDSAIEITAQQQGRDIWVGVADHGPGIKPDEIDQLFKNFGKASARPTGGEKSTGLGLAICKKIIEAHHGEIGVKAGSQQGAVFWFSLPITPASQEEEEVN